jgi:cation transporter-like permease
MTLLAASDPVVDWGKLGQVVAYSAVVGIGVAICFSLAILGATRFTEVRRGDGGVGAAVGYAVLATLGLLATVAAAVIAIVVMTKKG